MPVLLVVGVIYGHQTNLINLGLTTTVSLTVMGLLFLLGEWQRAQKERKEKMK